MMSRTPVFSGSYLNVPLLVTRDTEHSEIPASSTILDSMPFAQDAYVMPVICKKEYSHNKKRLPCKCHRFSD